MLFLILNNNGIFRFFVLIGIIFYWGISGSVSCTCVISLRTKFNILLLILRFHILESQILSFMGLTLFCKILLIHGFWTLVTNAIGNITVYRFKIFIFSVDNFMIVRLMFLESCTLIFVVIVLVRVLVVVGTSCFV